MTTPKTQTPFEIIVGDPGGEIQNGDVPIRWCVTPTLVKNMEDDGIKDPHILIVTWNKKSNPQIMQQQLVPLADLMTYARFTKAGESKIHAWIVDGATGRKDIHKRFVERNRSGSVNVIAYYDNQPVPPSEVDALYALTSATVSIPDGVFGKEPPRWLKWFVNLWHEKKVVDECHYRQRTIFAFTLKWIPVLAWTLLQISLRVGFASLITLAGFRKVPKWKYVLKPWSTTFDMAISANVIATEIGRRIFNAVA